MRKTDISQYTGTSMPNGSPEPSAGSTALSVTKRTLSVVWKAILTVLMVALVTGIIVGISMLFYIASLSGETVDFDLRASKLNQTSYIWVQNENGDFYEAQEIQAETKSEWVGFEEIPESMKQAMIAIEDRRFEEHHGVDWIRTGGAILNLATGHKSGSNFGGSTLTQQLIKNLTNDNDVSLTRKLREIFRALNFEKKYSKDEILEMYLNVVNFGSGCLGVQAAANLYFDKDIQDCSVAECAAIAGITQNPTAYTPLLHPQANKERREVVLGAMHEQGKLTDQEYAQAMEDSQNMTFAEHDDSNLVDNQIINNWYYEAMIKDVVNDLAAKRNIGTEEADRQLRTQGLKVYCAMDPKAQAAAENVMTNEENMPADTDIQASYVMVGYDGRVLASVGQRGEKEGNLWMDYSTTSKYQTGSCIKPISVYAPALEAGRITYSTLIKDEPIVWDVDGDGVKENNWPPNADRRYHGDVLLVDGLKQSYNAVAAQVLMNKIDMGISLDFLIDKVGITSLNRQEDMLPSALATGGGVHGISVREMTAAFQIFGNGGVYHKPYTYFYVKDDQDNIILDNRDNSATQAISSANATIMRELLFNVVNGGTGTMAAIPGQQVFGKTGSTDNYDNCWFIGGTPYAVGGVWTGHPTPKAQTGNERNYAKTIWKKIMQEYLQDKEKKTFERDPGAIAKTYCKSTGLLANPDTCKETGTGYYTEGNMPQVCDGNHKATDETSSNVSSALEPIPSSGASSSSTAPSSSESPSSLVSDSTSEGSSSSDASSESSSSQPEESNTSSNNSSQPAA